MWPFVPNAIAPTVLPREPNRPYTPKALTNVLNHRVLARGQTPARAQEALELAERAIGKEPPSLWSVLLAFEFRASGSRAGQASRKFDVLPEGIPGGANSCVVTVMK